MKKINIFTATMTIWEMYVLAIFKNANGSAEVLEENNFYPFGLKHEGYNSQTGNPSYNYEYSGKELQKETGWNDFGARMYMADIARWGVIDPLAETTTRVSPYNYALNNPVMFVDPDGRKAYDPEALVGDYARGGALEFYMRGGFTTFGSFDEFLGTDPYALYRKSNMGVYGGGSDPTPKNDGPGIIERLGNFISGIFGGGHKSAKVSTFLAGATVSRAGTLEVGQLIRLGLANLEVAGTLAGPAINLPKSSTGFILV